MGLSEPRVPPLAPSEWDDDTRKLMEGLRREGIVFNIFATLARHPKLFNRWLGFGTHVLYGSTLPAREREMIILRTGWLCRAEYEWGHHVAIGKHAGVTNEDIERIKQGAEAPGLDPFEATILRAVDELHTDSFISDSTWKTLAQRYNTQQLMDFVFAVGQYKLVSMALNTLGVQLEAGFEGFPK